MNTTEPTAVQFAQQRPLYCNPRFTMLQQLPLQPFRLQPCCLVLPGTTWGYWELVVATSSDHRGIPKGPGKHLGADHAWNTTGTTKAYRRTPEATWPQRMTKKAWGYRLELPGHACGYLGYLGHPWAQQRPCGCGMPPGVLKSESIGRSLGVPGRAWGHLALPGRTVDCCQSPVDPEQHWCYTYQKQSGAAWNYWSYLTWSGLEVPGAKTGPDKNTVDLELRLGISASRAGSCLGTPVVTSLGPLLITGGACGSRNHLGLPMHGPTCGHLELPGASWAIVGDLTIPKRTPHQPVWSARRSQQLRDMNVRTQQEHNPVGPWGGPMSPCPCLFLPEGGPGWHPLTMPLEAPNANLRRWTPDKRGTPTTNPTCSF